MAIAASPIIWTIAGADSGGGAGIQADLKAFQGLGTYGCSVITALTAQNSHAVTAIDWTPAEFVQAQLAALQTDLPPAAIKTGMLGTPGSMSVIATNLAQLNCPIVCDPVMVSTSGSALADTTMVDYFLEHLMPLATVITPNLPEAAALVKHPIHSPAEVETAAQSLINRGAKSVLIKGGHSASDSAADFWTDGQTKWWFTTPRVPHTHTHGSGCTLSAAIAAALGLGHAVLDAIVIAKTYVQRGIRLAVPYGKGPGPVAHATWPDCPADFPCAQQTLPNTTAPLFPSCGLLPFGFYPIVASFAQAQQWLPSGATMLQLRIKDKHGQALAEEIKQTIQLAQHYPQVRLFINDYWELALQYGAYGVHLGQEDLAQANLRQIAQADLRLGISTHNYLEAAIAKAANPSYIAIGPVFAPLSKQLSYPPLGLAALARLVRLAPCPTVTIGGILAEHLPALASTGVAGVAAISALNFTQSPQAMATRWNSYFKP